VDKGGRKVYSDKMPPPDIPPERIVKGPKGQMQQIAPAAATQAEAAAPAGNAPANAAMPRPAGKDQALEDKKKELAAKADASKKAEDAKYAALRADNCSRAKSAKATYAEGSRLTRRDEKGEVVYIDDKERLAEIKRLEEVIARDCAQ